MAVAEAAAPRLRALAARSDLVFIGLDEAARLWGAEVVSADDVRALLPEPRLLVVKDGAVGATEFARDAAGGADVRTHVPALSVEVVEQVGAGDAFAAGYLARTARRSRLRRPARHGPRARGARARRDRRLPREPRATLREATP